jgi:hypothetical protein
MKFLTFTLFIFGIFAQSTNGDILNTINDFRAKHSSPSVVFDASLNSSAQIWANYLTYTNTFSHSSTTNGENLAMFYENNATSAVNMWYQENILYDYSNPVFSITTAHFTALVWKNTQQIGLGISQYPTTKAYVFVMQFYPAGNVIGQFAINVLPPNNSKSPTLPQINPPPPQYSSPPNPIGPRFEQMNFYISSKSFYSSCMCNCTI